MNQERDVQKNYRLVKSDDKKVLVCCSQTGSHHGRMGPSTMKSWLKGEVPPPKELRLDPLRATPPLHLAVQHADVLPSLRDCQVEQLLDGQHVRMLHAHHRDVIQAVKVGQGLECVGGSDRSSMQHPCRSAIPTVLKDSHWRQHAPF